MAREIWVDVKVMNFSNRKKCVTVRAFVDNGSTESALPASILRRIGVKPEGIEEYEIWGGKVVRRRRGHARFQIKERSGICGVTFEHKDEVPTIGATTLEALGFDIDMKNGGLRPFKRRGPHIRRRARFPLP